MAVVVPVCSSPRRQVADQAPTRSDKGDCGWGAGRDWSVGEGKEVGKEGRLIMTVVTRSRGSGAEARPRC